MDYKSFSQKDPRIPGYGVLLSTNEDLSKDFEDMFNEFFGLYPNGPLENFGEISRLIYNSILGQAETVILSDPVKTFLQTLIHIIPESSLKNQSNLLMVLSAFFTSSVSVTDYILFQEEDGIFPFLCSLPNETDDIDSLSFLLRMWGNIAVDLFRLRKPLGFQLDLGRLGAIFGNDPPLHLLDSFYTFSSMLIGILPVDDYYRELVAFSIYFYRPASQPKLFFNFIKAIIARFPEEYGGPMEQLAHPMQIYGQDHIFCVDILPYWTNPFESSNVGFDMLSDDEKFSFAIDSMLVLTMLLKNNPNSPLRSKIPLEPLTHLCSLRDMKNEEEKENNFELSSPYYVKLLPQQAIVPYLTLFTEILEPYHILALDKKEIVETVYYIATKGSYQEREAAVKFLKRVMEIVNTSFESIILLFTDDKIMTMIFDTLDPDNLDLIEQSLSFLNYTLDKAPWIAQNIAHTLQENYSEMLDELASPENPIAELAVAIKEKVVSLLRVEDAEH